MIWLLTVKHAFQHSHFVTSLTLVRICICLRKCLMCHAAVLEPSCACLLQNPEYFKKLPEATDDELDMLDLAFGLSET